jgi:hypothetical protein
MKYFGTNSDKKAKDLYSKSYETLLRKIQQKPNKFKEICFHGSKALIPLTFAATQVMQCLSKF